MLNSILRTDILDDELVTTREGIRVIVEREFQTLVTKAVPVDKTKTPHSAKDIVEALELINEAIIQYEERAHTTEDGKIGIIYQDPDTELQLETISLMIADREAGMFGQGRPQENKIKNLRYYLRELVDDPDNPGYKRAVFGYFYDNILRMTCWARTNKQANKRALWLEDLMLEYTWFFCRSGINRILYDGWRQPRTIEINNNRYYGRPIDYFVRTEKIINVSQKTLEEICLRLAMRSTMT